MSEMEKGSNLEGGSEKLISNLQTAFQMACEQMSGGANPDENTVMSQKWQEFAEKAAEMLKPSFVQLTQKVKLDRTVIVSRLEGLIGEPTPFEVAVLERFKRDIGILTIKEGGERKKERELTEGDKEKLRRDFEAEQNSQFKEG